LSGTSDKGLLPPDPRFLDGPVFAYILYIFYQSLIKFGTENVSKNLANDNAFCENQCIYSHTSLAEANELLDVFATFIGVLGAVQCKIQPNAVG
jgi:hypothetical protein